MAPRFAAILAQPGGLTAADAARRASATSVQAAIEREDVRVASNDKQRVIWNAAPRLTLTGRTVRLSPVSIDLGAGGTVPQPVANHYLNANLTVPLTDYLLRLVQALRGANRNRSASQLSSPCRRRRRPIKTDWQESSNRVQNADHSRQYPSRRQTAMCKLCALVAMP